MSQDSEHARKFICAVCSCTFTPAYRLSRHRNLSYCSKRCAGKVKGGEVHRKSDLERRIVDLLAKAGRYMTKEEIIGALSVSSKTLTAFGVSTLACNKAAGYKKPARLFENMVLSALETKFDVVSEVSFDGCLSPNGHPLRFDFYVKEDGLLIEADGSQHRKGHPWHKPYHSECDKIKNDFAAKSGLRLVRIPYTKRVTPEYVFRALETNVATT